MLATGVIALVSGWGLRTTLLRGACVIVPFIAWTLYSQRLERRQLLLQGLRRDERRIALPQSLVALWLLEIVSLAFVGCGFWLLVIEPGRWLVALASIGFFGLCAATAARLLVLRRRIAPTRS